MGLPEGEGTMVASDISTGLSGRPRVLGRTLASIGVGILVEATDSYEGTDADIGATGIELGLNLAARFPL